MESFRKTLENARVSDFSFRKKKINKKLNYRTVLPYTRQRIL